MDQRIMQMRANQWREMLEAQAKSGMTKKDWCKANGISRAKFFRWQRNLRNAVLEKTFAGPKDDTLPSSGQGFAELSLAQVARPANNTRTSRNTGASQEVYYTETLCLHVSCGKFTVQIPEGVSDQLLLSVLKAVSHAD